MDAVRPRAGVREGAGPDGLDEPSGEKIQLAVIRHKASKPDQRIGSIFFNPGGPGDTGVGAVKGAADDLDAWGNGRFDIVSWDPRGTYGSSPIRCFTDDASEAAFWKDAKVPYTPEASVAYQQRVLDLAKRCGEVMGPLLSHVSTADTARDIDALRAVSARTRSPTSASRTGRSSARPTSTCSRSTCAP